jgi:4-hydroxybenzoate polyprenyltransferase
LKVLKFIINSNILIAFAAVSLTLASQVQLGMSPQPEWYLATLFFATLLDYNFHRLVTLKRKPENKVAEKYNWSAAHVPLLKILTVASLAGLAFTLQFAGGKVIVFLALMAVLTFLYSNPVYRKPQNRFLLLKIPGLKTFLIAFVWSAATVFLPVIHSDNSFNTTQVMLLFAERLTYVFAIAIPFDIRDTKEDELSGLRTIPIAVGEKAARRISNTVLLSSLAVAIFHYAYFSISFIIPAYVLCVFVTLLLTNYRKFQRLPYFYHGILDGSIFLYGIILLLSYYFRAYL